MKLYHILIWLQTLAGDAAPPAAPTPTDTDTVTFLGKVQPCKSRKWTVNRMLNPGLGSNLDSSHSEKMAVNKCQISMYASYRFWSGSQRCKVRHGRHGRFARQERDGNTSSMARRKRDWSISTRARQGCQRAADVCNHLIPRGVCTQVSPVLFQRAE